MQGEKTNYSKKAGTKKEWLLGISGKEKGIKMYNVI